MPMWRSLLFITCGAGLAACSASPPAAPSEVGAREIAAPNIAEDWARSQPDTRKPLSVATFALASAEPLPPNPEAAQRSLEAKLRAGFAQPPAELAEVMRGHTLPAALSLRVLAPGELPLHWETLAQANAAQADALRAARSVIVVRVSADAEGLGRTARSAALAALLLAQEGQMIVDLSLWRAFSVSGLRADLAREDWWTDQVLPDLAQQAEGTLQITSRGMGRFGLPDLQCADVPVAEGRAAFQRFQEQLNALRLAGPGSPLAAEHWAAAPCDTAAADGECRQVRCR